MLPNNSSLSISASSRGRWFCSGGNPCVSKSQKMFECLALYYSLGAKRAALLLPGGLYGGGRGLEGFTTGGQAAPRLRGRAGTSPPNNNQL